MKNNENASLCSGCGECCKRMPGIVHPNELGEITVESLSQMIKDGYQFDYWEGNITGKPEHDEITAYYLRPQIKHSVAKVVDASWGGECVFLTETGCSKTFEQRPTQCRALKPSESGNCSYEKKYSKVEVIKAWLPYNEVIVKLVNEHYGY
jgi:Fe-S-cluster containining protein